MSQLSLFEDEAPAKPQTWPNVPADLTCVVCGKTEPNEYVYSINHSYSRPGWCMSQHLRQNHVKAHLRSLQRIDANEEITNSKGKPLNQKQRDDLRVSTVRQLVTACERAVDATTSRDQVVAACAEYGYSMDGEVRS